MDKKFNFKAYVTNLGKYNEGELLGEWVSFPTTREDMQGVFERIGINKQYEEYFITDYDTDISNLKEKLGDFENVDSLNYLASRLNELEDYEFEMFKEVLSAGIDLAEPDGLETCINLTYNLDTYVFMPGVNDQYDLGHYLVNEVGGYDLEKMGDLANYIDYEAYGRDAMINDFGGFSDNGYISYTNEKWCMEFDGKEIPEEYRVTGTGGEKQQVQAAEPQEQTEVNFPEGIDEAKLDELAEEMLLEAQAASQGPVLGM
ncbi:MAG: antirestriction protein ArdA [Lachnospiraceae bacterium]|nr:antirestriction protein ArdA [Lachnospiraceae bacterium]